MDQERLGTTTAATGRITRVRTFPADEAALRTPAARVEACTPDVVAFARELIEWMRREDGLGLAATQVETSPSQIAPALFVMARGEENLVLINPIVHGQFGHTFDEEACLSFGRVTCTLVAPRTVHLGYTDLDGAAHTETFRGFAARCVAHEVDHLRGRLMIDRMLRRDQRAFLARLARETAATQR